MTQAQSDIDEELERRIETIRSFNRMYMQRIGVLAEKIFGSDFSLAEVRIINELSFRKTTTAAELCRDLSMDGGYISRILQGFERNGLITKARSKQDGRQRKITLTQKGRKAGEAVLSEARRKIYELIGPVSHEDQCRLVEAMQAIDHIINHKVAANVPPWSMRPHQAGDMGRIIHAHAIQFAADYGWNSEFEALVAEKTAEFIRNFDPARERCWVADLDSDIVGSLCLVNKGNDTGDLGLLYVAPKARKMGIGSSLLSEAVRFARHVGYKRLHLRTESVKADGAALVEAAGFRLAKQFPHRVFGKDETCQIWEMEL